MARKTTVTQLETQIQEAQEALESATEDQKPDLQSQISAKSAELDSLKANQDRQYGSEHEELIALRQEKRDQELRETAGQVAAQIHMGLKSAQEQEKARVSGLVQEEIAKALGGTDGAVAGFDIKSLIHSSLADMRFGRKTPMTTTEDQGERRTAPAIKSGKGTLITFLRALVEKDRSALRDVYQAHGMKALVEGGGAGSAGSLSAGGALVPPEYSTEIIELLRAAALVRKAGPEIVTMTSPQYFRARQATAGTASYIGETVAIPPSQETFDQVTLNAKKLAAIVPISNELLRDSNPNAERVVRDDLTAVIALKEDIQFLNGTGSSTAPTGLFKQSGIQTISPATNGDTVTYQTPIDMWFKLITANVQIKRPAWFCNPALIKTLLEVVDSNGRPIFLNFFNVQEGTFAPDKRQIGMMGTLLGIPLFTTTQLPLGITGSGNTTPLALIEMSYVLVGNMEDMYITTSDEASFYDGTNTISLWQSDMTGFRAIIRHDISLLQGAAVVVHNGLLY